MKKEKGITRIELLIAVFLVVAILLVGGSLLYQMTNKKQKSSEHNEVANTPLSTEIARNSVVIDGFKISIPEECDYWIDEDGLMIEDENLTWRMRYDVKEDSYEEKIKNPDELMSGVVEKGLKIIEPIKEVTINGKKYAYFTYEQDSEKLLVAYTKANSEKRFGINATGEGKDYVSAILNVFDKVASTAIETDEPNTSEEDAFESNRELPGVAKEFGELTLNGVTVKYRVPKTFYSIQKIEDESLSYEDFTTADSKVSVSCSLHSSLSYDNADEYLKEQIRSGLFEDAENVERSNVETYHNVKYITLKFKHNHHDWKILYAICELSNGYNLRFEAQTLQDEEKNLTIDTVKDFFNITEE